MFYSKSYLQTYNVYIVRLLVRYDNIHNNNMYSNVLSIYVRSSNVRPTCVGLRQTSKTGFVMERYKISGNFRDQETIDF